ncbi:MAG: hypothetical protein JW983_09940 [Elusimicrobia bacterium]|nr:hypothetical protein [Elusimicrobiota bacterium]
MKLEIKIKREIAVLENKINKLKQELREKNDQKKRLEKVARQLFPMTNEPVISGKSKAVEEIPR